MINGKVDSDGDRRVTVAELAAQLGVPSAWLVELCLQERVPDVTGESSLLRPDWCCWIQDRVFRHPELAVQQQMIGSKTEQESDGSEIQGGDSCPSDRVATELENMVAKAKDLIDGRHFDCVMLTLYAAIEGELKARDRHGHGVDNGLIDAVLEGLEHETIRKDLHRIRALTNRVRHDRLAPAHYDAEKALWVFCWLFGPHGPFCQTAPTSA